MPVQVCSDMTINYAKNAKEGEMTEAYNDGHLPNATREIKSLNFISSGHLPTEKYSIKQNEMLEKII